MVAATGVIECGLVVVLTTVVDMNSATVVARPIVLAVVAVLRLVATRTVVVVVRGVEAIVVVVALTAVMVLIPRPRSSRRA